MKFTRINDLLILTEKGENVKQCDTVEAEFKNPGSSNCVVLCKGPWQKEKGRFDVTLCEGSSSYKSSCPTSIISEDDSYVVKLVEKNENEEKTIATGSFKVTGGVICSCFGIYEHELEKLWATFLYIADKLGIDEAVIDTLMTGYITE